MVKKASFFETKVTRFNVSFSEENQFVVVCLKQTKTDIKHIGAQIILAVTSEKTCPIAAIIYFYTLDHQPANASLFLLSSNIFLHFGVMSALKKRISLAGLAQFDYSNNSFRPRAAQHVADHGMFDKMMQKVGRWTSNVFRLYFTTLLKSLDNLKLNFQKGIPHAVPRATVPTKNWQGMKK